MSSNDELVEVNLGKKDELDFHPSTYSSSSVGSGIDSGSGIGSMRSGPLGVGASTRSNDNTDPAGGPGGISVGFCPFLNIGFYQPYFDVNTADVGKRMKSVATPWKDDFFENVAPQPEMYGPFWISTTLVFLIAVTANINSYLSSSGEWNYNIKFLSVAASVIYGFCLVTPGFFWLSLRYQDASSSLSVLQVLTIYGYSIIAFLPASLLCIIPSHAVQWLAVCAAFGFSAVFLTRNIWKAITGTSATYSQITSAEVSTSIEAGSGAQSARPRAVMTTMAGIVFIHAVFALCMKIMFFVGAEINIDPDSNSHAVTNSTVSNGKI